MRLIERAHEEEKREIHYRLWLVKYPLYTKDNYEPFDVYYENAIPRKIEYDSRPKEVLMAEVLEIQSKAEGRDD